ncbi:MAG: alpha-ketoacid dehydrogenase subunit beta [Armatimonadota bacterium]
MREINFATAVGEALREEMERDERVFLIGEDIGPVREPGDDLWGQFRERRVWQTPISEAGFTGLAVGAAAAGLRPVVEIMYCDFVTCCMDAICNQAAKINLMSGSEFKVPMVIKTPAGAGTREGAHHSQSLEAWFMHTPGLKVVMPGTPADAKGLLKAAIRDDTPVVYIQHRLLHPQMGEVPDTDYVIPLGQAKVKREGTDITVVAYSYALTKVMAAAEVLAGDVSVEVVDPRTLVPLDLETLTQSVSKTRRLLVVHEATERGGAGAEIVRQVVAQGIEWAAPPQVLGGKPVPMPYSPPLEDHCLPQVSDIVSRIRALVG